MLQRFQITKLFNLYSYDLNLSNGADDDIRFVMGPNGYGKTTILRFINAIYHKDLSVLVDKNNPFEKLIMTIDGAVLTIERVVKVAETQEDDGDEGQETKVTLHCTFVTPEKDEEFDVASEHASNSAHMGLNFQLFFGSHRCYFIDDQRLALANTMVIDDEVYIKTDESSSPIMERSRKFASQLKKNTVSPAVQLGKDYALPEDEYYARCRVLNEKIARLKKYKLVGDVVLSADYQDQLQAYLTANLIRLEEAVNNVEPFLHRVEKYEEIIKDFEFVDKDLVINPNPEDEDAQTRSGFRFVLQDKDHTKLLNNRLSSGEKHLMVMFYDLLFEAATDDMLFLIDEPELSFHLAWQKEYMRILKSVCELRKLQCVSATHSTDVFDSDFEYTVDLCEAHEMNQTEQEDYA